MNNPLVADVSSCQHPRILEIYGKSVDSGFTVIWPNGEEGHPYLPHIPGLGGGEMIDIKVCIDCGRLVAFPAGQDDVILVDQPDKIDGFEPRTERVML